MDTREGLLLNNRFLVSIGRDLFSFAKVSNLSDSFEMESIRQGGANRYPEFLAKQKEKRETLILEKGVQKKEGDSEKKLKPGARVSAVAIMVLNHGKVEKTYSFDYGVITKKEITPLDAMGKEVLINKLEITHTGLTDI